MKRKTIDLEQGCEHTFNRLKKLDEHLLARTYITGHQVSKYDFTVFSALRKPSTSAYVNVSRWYNHIDAVLKQLNEHLRTRSYISGYQASKNDYTVFAALGKPPTSAYVYACRWYNHIDALLKNPGRKYIEEKDHNNENFWPTGRGKFNLKQESV